MHVAIDARAASEVPAGRGRYVRELLRALAARDDDHRYDLIARTPWGGSLDERFRWRCFPGTDPWWPLGVGPRLGRVDVTLATNSYLFAVTAPRPTVAFVHDMVVFDPESRPPAGAAAERVTLPLAVRRATAFACNSGATRDALVARFPAVAGRTVVTPLGVDQTLAAQATRGGDVVARLRLPQRYVLSVGTREPRKNLVRAIAAFAELPADVRAERRLVIVGHPGWDDAEIDTALRDAGDLVHLAGFVDDADLPAVYAAADAFVYVSFHEGFGLPVLEAMAVGTPVVTSNVSSLPEVAGDAALTVDPRSVPAIRDALSRVLSDGGLAASLIERGTRRATAYSWARTADTTLALLADARKGR
ncbi:glycosyltransferase family 1 protein [Patulibacter sp. SYSU D01012]|uniref:glycosyltransferase family 4 protein n=1 Tax=Patulibacter sp. SYSU D01012 TaxID=2817381 RepID=UPI001B3014DA|nr:glycosyltransferase family 1 protein [Patulibacter sp. SYSU D01012]